MKQVSARISQLVTVLVLGALIFLTSGTARPAVPVVAAPRVDFTKQVSLPMAQAGEIVTFSLRLSLTPGPPVYVRVYDPNPAPQYLEVLPSTITGGAVYSPTIDGIEWGPHHLIWGDDPIVLSFQARVLDLQDPVPERGIAVTNVATLVDPTPTGSLPEQSVEVTLVLGVFERQFLPLTLREDVPGESPTLGEPQRQPETGVASSYPPTYRERPPDRRFDWPESGHLAMLPMVWNDDCRPSRTIESPFGIEISALHQVRPPEELEALREPAWSQSTFADLLDALEQSGAGWTRVHISWQELQPDSPTFDADGLAWYDERLARVAGSGVRIIATIADAPDWAADLPCAPFHTDRLDDFSQFLGDLVRRYQELPYNIHHWELINEPDSTWRVQDTNGLGCWADASTDQDGRRYADMLAVAYQAIKAADPDAAVLMGGVAHDWFTEPPYNGLFDRYFPDDVMRYGGGNYIDALSMHYFYDWHAEWERWDPDSLDRQNGWLPAPTCGDLFDGAGQTYDAWGVGVHAKATHFSNRLSTCFGVDKPLWITELAEHGYAGDPGSLAQQARYVIQGYARALAAGAENITWYALTTPNDSYEQGLLYDDWTPKPAFYAYQTMTTELAGHEYASTLTIAGGEAYVFVNVCGQRKTVAWGSGVLTISGAGSVRVVDRWGVESFVQDGGPNDDDGVQNGSVALSLSPEPVFVSIGR